MKAERPNLSADLHKLGLVAAVGSLAIITACAPLEPQRPPRPPEVRAVTTVADKPVVVPCFTEAERPVLAPPTPIDLTFGKATADQYAAALAADDLAEQQFAREVDALFIKCSQAGGLK